MGRHKAFPKKLYRHDMGTCLREIFNPACCKHLRRAAGDYDQQQRRWKIRDVLLAGMALVLQGAPTLAERFAAAREWLGTIRPKRRRPGRTLKGYLGALRRVPFAGLAAFKNELQAHMGVETARVGRWLAYGLDGSKQDLPRTKANERHHPVPTRGPETAQALVATAYALGTNVLWDWTWGPVVEGERALGLHVVRRLPPHSLVVTDAGFVGYEWVAEVLRGGRHVLLRVGANCRLWTAGRKAGEWRDGEVWLWPRKRRRAGPLRLRLIRLVRGRGRRKTEVWLLTDILAEDELGREEAGRLYARRWGGNEVGHRSWKRTLAGHKLLGRTPDLAEREGELTLLAQQWLATLVLLARRRRRKRRKEQRRERKVSIAAARQVWQRGVRSQAAGRSTRWMRTSLSEAVVDEYERKKPKQKRKWAKRKEHRSPGRPRLRRLPKRLKLLGERRLAEAAG